MHLILNRFNPPAHFHFPNNLLLVIGGAILVSLIVLATPQILSIHYLNLGGRWLQYATNSAPQMKSVGVLCAMNANFDSSRQEMVDQAISDLNIAITYNRKNQYIHLLLGRAYCLSGDYENAIRSLQYYVDKKSKNPLGHLELGYAFKHFGDLDSSNTHWSKTGIAIDEIKRINAVRWNDDNLSNEYENYLILESFGTVESWLPNPSNSPGNITAMNGVMTMSYANNLNQRDIFGFSNSTQTNITTYSKLLIRLRGNPGTLFTFETIIDGSRKREINYQPILYEWVVLVVPIQGDTLNGITIGIGEPNATPVIDHYELLADWIVVQ